MSASNKAHLWSDIGWPGLLHELVGPAVVQRQFSVTVRSGRCPPCTRVGFAVPPRRRRPFPFHIPVSPPPFSGSQLRQALASISIFFYLPSQTAEELTNAHGLVELEPDFAQIS